MASSLFQGNQMMNTPKNNLVQLANVFKGNPEAIYNQLYQTNPQFKRFIDENQGLTNEQIAQKYGIPL